MAQTVPVRPWRSELRRKQREREAEQLYETADHQTFLRDNPVVRKLATTENAVIRQRRHMPMLHPQFQPDPHRAQGAATKFDKHNVQALTSRWHRIQPNPVEDWGHDFVRLNKLSQGTATNSRTVGPFREANDVRRQPRSAIALARRREREAREGVVRRPSSAERRIQDEVHGEPTFWDAATVGDLMQNRFQYDWVKQQAWRQEQRQQRQQHQELKKQEGLERLQRLRTQRRSVLGPESQEGTLDVQRETVHSDREISAFARKFREQVTKQKAEAGLRSRAAHDSGAAVASPSPSAAAVTAGAVAPKATSASVVAGMAAPTPIAADEMPARPRRHRHSCSKRRHSH